MCKTHPFLGVCIANDPRFEVSLLFTALYKNCPYCSLLYMQSVLIIYCFICNLFVLFTALYATCPYYLLLCMQSVLIYVLLYMKRVVIIYCFICNASLLCTALYATCSYSLLLYMQRGHRRACTRTGARAGPRLRNSSPARTQIALSTLVGIFELALTISDHNTLKI